MACTNGWIECHPGIAAWVQATGVILGILLAVLIPAWQRRSERRQARADTALKLRAIARIAHEAASFATETVQELNQLYGAPEFSVYRFDLDRLKHLSLAVSEIQLSELPTPGSVEAVITAQQGMARFADWTYAANSTQQADLVASAQSISGMTESATHLVDADDRLQHECNVIERGHDSFSRLIARRLKMSIGGVLRRVR